MDDASRAEPEFYALRDRVFALLEEGREDQALPLALQAKVAYPSRGEILFWLACILSRLGRSDEALTALEAGLDEGLWWADDWLREDDDLAPLRSEPRFAAVLRRSAELSRGWTVEPARLGLLLAPAGLRKDAPAGAVVALHGWGQRAADFGVHWQPALDEGLLVSVPESSQAGSPEFFVWTGRAAAERDIAAAYAALRHAHTVDERRLVAAGFSQGGGLAVSIALTGRPMPATAFIAFGAGLDDVDAAALTKAASAARRGVRGVLVVGAEDEALPGARELQARLHVAGLACSLTVLPGLAHAMPSDHQLIAGSLRSVLQS